jgi:hypothetical protein
MAVIANVIPQGWEAVAAKGEPRRRMPNALRSLRSRCK